MKESLLGLSRIIPTHWPLQTQWSIPLICIGNGTIGCSGTMPSSSSFALFLFPNYPLTTFPADAQCGLVMVALGEPPRCQMNTDWSSIQRERETNNIPRHRAHVMLGEVAVIGLAGTVMIESLWMWCCAIRDWVWSEIEIRTDERLQCWRDGILWNWLVQDSV